MDLPAFADSTTKILIAALTIVATTVVIIGLGKAIRERRRPQVVITDITPIGAAAAGPQADAINLSPWLRQRVRYTLASKRLDADWILGESLLGRDIRLGRLPVRLEQQVIVDQVTSAARDTLVTLTQGLKAVAPQQADGLLGALATVLPAPRGHLVRTMSVVRNHTSGPQLGLAIEVQGLDGTPKAATLFWDWVDGNLDAHQHTAILVEIAAEWIATKLIAFRLQSRAARRGTARLPENMQGLLSGAMTLNTMRSYPQFALALGEEAEASLGAAQKALPEYHRPAAILAAVLERLGFAHRDAGSGDLARNMFDRAATSWHDARELLTKPTGADVGTSTDTELADEVARLRLRWLKCVLLAERPDARTIALNNLRTESLQAGYHPRTLYNAACLCALLLPEHLTDAWNMLGRALLTSSGAHMWRWAPLDPDLEPLPGRSRFIEYLQIQRHGATDEATLIKAAVDAAVASHGQPAGQGAAP